MVELVEVKAKEQLYRGIPLEALKKLEVREFAKYLSSRSRRTVLRNFNTIEKFIKRCEKRVLKNRKIRTHLRDIVILPKMVGMTIQVYNGKTFTEVRITHLMIGHRLGEFALTRERVVHGDPGIGSTKSSATAQK